MQYNQIATQQTYQGPTHAQVHGQRAGFGQMVPGMYMQPVTTNYQYIQAINPIQGGGQYTGTFAQTVPATGHQMPNSMYSYQTTGYGQFHQDNQILNQQMYGLSVTGQNIGGFRTNNSTARVTPTSYLPPMKSKPKPEDSLFGDLVDLNKFKPVK